MNCPQCQRPYNEHLGFEVVDCFDRYVEAQP